MMAISDPLKLVTGHPSTRLRAGRSLITRPRRLRQTEALRAMVRETELNPRDLIYPLFVRHGQGRTPIASMPGIAQLSVDEALREAEVAASLGVPAVILFGIPAEKDPVGLENFAPMGSSSRLSGLSSGKSLKWWW
jgi:delta-aminolevulinic acid dehydratase/porphobilinogen synthase